MVVLSAKLTILISWSLIRIPLILLSALMKLSSTSAAILYNSIENIHPWQTHIRVKGSNRRPFTLIFDSISYEWICFHIQTYAKQKRYKSKSTLRILQKDFYRFIWLSSYVTNSRKSVYSKVILFLIASDWCPRAIVRRLSK